MHDLDFVEALGAPGPSKSEVESLDFVGQKVPVQMLCFWFCGGGFGVFQKCVHKIPNPTRSILGRIYI